ncbi:MAG: ATP-binding protein [Bacteroidota bacterium]
MDRIVLPSMMAGLKSIIIAASQKNEQMKYARIGLWWALGLFPILGAGQPLYQIDPQFPVHDLGAHLELILDSAEVFSPEQILHDSSLVFTIQDEETRYLEIGATYWGRISVETTESLPGWTLNFEDRLHGLPAWTRSNGQVDVYAFAEGRLLFHLKTGVEYPRQERAMAGQWMINRVPLDELPLNQEVEMVIKIKGNSIGFPPYFHATIRSPQQPFYHALFAFDESFNLFLLGCTFIIFLYHFLQFLYLRERLFLWFSVWVLFCCLTMAMSVGLIIGSMSQFRYPVWLIFASGVLYSFWVFGRSFIKSKEKFPRLDKFMLLLSGLMLTEVLLTALYVIIFDPQIYVTGVGLHYVMLVLFAALSTVLSILLVFKKDRFAKYFGFGAMIFSLAILSGGLWSARLISLPFDPYAWGMFLQIVVFSFGIAYRQRTLLLKTQEERLAAQRNYVEMERIKDLDEIKTQFYTNLSHEFRTPLALIAGPLELARKSQAGPEDQIQISTKTFELIERNTNRLQSLIDQLLELSKLETGKVYLKLGQGDVVQFVKVIAHSFESISESRGLSFNTSFPEALPDAFFDRDKLEKIISNLLSNAFKYTPDGGAVTLMVDYTDTHFVIEISDTGTGIAKEEMKRIFERFYRVEGTETKGSGIGLALTKELVDLHNGQISVSSSIGEGTSFKVRIPYLLDLLPEHHLIDAAKGDLGQAIPGAAAEHKQDMQALEEAKPLPSSSSNASAKSLVLVVEDNPDLRQHITTILQTHFRVITAEDGVKGERLAIEHIPDVIISDIMMPKKDGYQLCNDLKSNTKTSHIPIVMLTAKAGQENKLEGFSLGADAYLTKPFNADELLLRIKNLIDSRVKLWEHFNAMGVLVVRDVDMHSVEDQFLEKVLKAIRANLDNEFLSVGDLAKEVGFSKSQLHRKLKAICNKSPNQLIIEFRLNEAKRMLEDKAGTVSEVAYSVGYSNMSYFTKSFKEQFGVLPSKV